MTELARQLSRQSGDAAAARAVVPNPVRVITSARLAELSVPTRSVLKAAAVLGARFRRDVLAQLTGVPAGELAEALAAGRDARLLDPAGAGEDRFRHEMVRDAIYDAIPEAAREERHAQAGRVLAGLAGRGRDVDDAEAAYHLVRAGPAATAQATDYARRAGDQAMAALAFEDAARWYQHVADRLAARRAGDAEQAANALSLGAARLAAGDPDGGRAGFRQAAERARRARRPDLLARAALGLGGGPAGFEVQLLDGEQISLLEEARFALAGAAAGGGALGARRDRPGRHHRHRRHPGPDHDRDRAAADAAARRVRAGLRAGDSRVNRRHRGRLADRIGAVQHGRPHRRAAGVRLGSRRLRRCAGARNGPPYPRASAGPRRPGRRECPRGVGHASALTC